MLVPRKWSERLKKVDASIIFLWKAILRLWCALVYAEHERTSAAYTKQGTSPKVEIALDEMEAYSYWSTQQTDDIITRWATGVMARLEDSEYFQLMPDQLKTNMSIISFQVWVGGRALYNAQLKELFKAIATSQHEGFKDGINKVFFGQPVQYGDRSFIRLAIGAYTVRILEKDAIDSQWIQSRWNHWRVRTKNVWLISQTDIEKIISSAKSLLGAEDTSVIVAHLPVLRERLDHLKASFAPGVLHAIAIKTNPHPEMLAHIVRQGFGLEAASIEEVELALEAGASTSHIVFDSPVKTQLEIDRVSQMQGMLVNVNSIEELKRFPKTVKCILGIRINPQVHTGAPQMFDVSRNESKFGVALTDRDQIVQAALEYPVGALHIHSGSQMRDLEVQYGALRDLKSLADEINEKQPGKIKVLDIGGGLPTEELHEESAMRSYGTKVTALFGQSSYQLVTEFGHG